MSWRFFNLDDATRKMLERWSRGRSTQARLVRRARFVLSAAEGKENKDIAIELKITRGAVARWRDRFAGSGIAGLKRTRLAADDRQRRAMISSDGSSR